MAKISATSFANSVDENRKRLIQHCRNNKVEVSDTASLDKVVDVTRGINFPADYKPIKVEILDIDCSEIVPTYYVEKGADVVLPDITPNFDEEHLEFGSWAISGGDELTNVQRNITCMPHYKTRYDETIGQRPTYIQCHFDDTTLNPTINFSAVPTNTYIDWGDGSEVQQVTAKTIAHTYSSKGFYWLKIYGDKYSLGGASYGMFSSSTFAYCVTKLYLGENNTLAKLTSNFALEFFVFDTTLTTLPNSVISSYYALKSLIIPTGVTSLGEYNPNNCTQLKKIILPSTLKTIGRYSIGGCHAMEHISLPNSLTTIGEYCFGSYNLKELIIPDSVTSISGSFCSGCYNLKKLVLSKGLTSLGSLYNVSFYTLEEFEIPPKLTSGVALSGVYSLKKLYIPKMSGTITHQFTGACVLTEVILEDDYDTTLSLGYSPLTEDCLIDIANKLKDNTGLTARTLTLSKNLTSLILNSTYLNEFGGKVPYGTEGAVSILQFIQNKNWTVTLM